MEGAVDLGKLRRGCEGVGQPAELVDQPELTRGAAGPDAALGDRLDLFDGLLAAFCDEAGEAGIDVLDPRLRELVELFVDAAEDVGLARERGGADAVGGDTDLGERLVETRQDAEDADRAGDRLGLGKDAVGGGRDPIACLLYTSRCV